VAGSGCGWQRAGCLAATTLRHEGGKAFFPQTAEETRFRASRNCHRPTQELRGSKETSAQERGASTAQRVKQSSGKLSSAHTSARATDAAIQIPRASPTLSFRIWTDSRPLSSETTSAHRTTIPRTTAPTI